MTKPILIVGMSENDFDELATIPFDLDDYYVIMYKHKSIDKPEFNLLNVQDANKITLRGLADKVNTLFGKEVMQLS